MRSLPRDHLSWRVIDFLNHNRGEMLTRSDIAVKFDADASMIDNLLAPAIAAGLLKADHNRADGLVWMRPPKMGNLPMPFAPSLSAAARTIRAAKTASRRADYEAITIEHGIPVCEPAQTGGHWNALFDRMAPGDSFRVPDRLSSALCHAKLKYCKMVVTARFVTRKVEDNHTRIWRTA